MCYCKTSSRGQLQQSFWREHRGSGVIGRLGLEHRLHVLQSQGRLSKLASAMTLGLDAFSCRFPSSPDTATNTGKKWGFDSISTVSQVLAL